MQGAPSYPDFSTTSNHYHRISQRTDPQTTCLDRINTALATLISIVSQIGVEKSVRQNIIITEDNPLTEYRSLPLKKITYTSVGLLLMVAMINLGAIYLIRNPITRAVFMDCSSILFNLLATIALYLAARRSRLFSRRLFWAWGILALAQLSFTLGDAAWAILELRLGLNPFPSIADVFYLLFYPLFFIGILTLPTLRMERLNYSRLLLDVCIILVAATVGYWNLLLGPVVAARVGQPLLNQIISLAYPVGDLVLIFATLKLLYLQTEADERMPFLFLISGTVVMVLTDSIYGYQTISKQYVSGNLLDLGWIISYYLIGMAGIWQAFRPFDSTGRERHAPVNSTSQPGSSTWLAFLPYIWIPIACAILILEYTRQISFDLLTMIGIILIICLVFVRQVTTLRDNKVLFGQLNEALDQVKQRTVELRRANQELRWEVHERMRIEKQMAYDSLHDGTTGLPNRTLFMDRLKHALEYTKRHEDFSFSVIFLDIDHFKEINEGLGHLIGDKVLVEAAQRMLGCLRTSDTIARLAGDEYIILLEDIHGPEDVLQVTRRIQESLKEPFILEGRLVSITASFGIVANGNCYDQGEEVLRDADIAMYEAKTAGKARFVIFDPQMRDQAAWRLKMKADLQKAVMYGEFFLNYQPIFVLSTDRILGFEALLRWQHPQNGVISPLDFIPLAEETGLIRSIGLWVLEQACRQISEWQTKFPQTPPLTMSVNISSVQINQPDFVEQVQEILARTGVDGHSLILEITEGILLNRSESVTAKFNAINALGVQFQIDDFGTGYSSLSYVRDFPVSTIKIDRSFIQNLGVDSTGDIVRAIINMAHNLRQSAIAEGIETEAQLEYLKQAYCEAGQGYLLGRPQSVVDVEKLLRLRKRDAVTVPVQQRRAIIKGKIEPQS
jgi:diguanylate cyclase (GGDEF)-like protein